MAAVAAVPDAEVGGEFIDAMDAPLVMAVMVNVVEKASGGRAKLGQPPAAPVVMADWDVQFVVVQSFGGCVPKERLSQSDATHRIVQLPSRH